VVQEKQGRGQDLFGLMNDPDRLKDAVYVEIGNLRPLIEDEKGARFQNRQAVLYNDGTAKLWGLQQKASIAPPLHHKGPIRELTFFDASGLLITTSDDSIKAWDALTGEFRKELEGQSIRPLWLSFAPAGKRFLTIDAARTTVTVWDAARLVPVATIRPEGAEKFVEAGLSPDGRTVVTFRFGDDPSAQLWDVASGRPFASLRPPSVVAAEVFAEGGTSLNKSKVEHDARFWEVVRSLAPAAGRVD
jgi:WD40 repeat protein